MAWLTADEVQKASHQPWQRLQKQHPNLSEEQVFEAPWLQSESSEPRVELDSPTEDSGMMDDNDELMDGENPTLHPWSRPRGRNPWSTRGAQPAATRGVNRGLHLWRRPVAWHLI